MERQAELERHKLREARDDAERAAEKAKEEKEDAVGEMRLQLLREKSELEEKHRRELKAKDERWEVLAKEDLRSKEAKHAQLLEEKEQEIASLQSDLRGKSAEVAIEKKARMDEERRHAEESALQQTQEDQLGKQKQQHAEEVKALRHDIELLKMEADGMKEEKKKLEKQIALLAEKNARSEMEIEDVSASTRDFVQSMELLVKMDVNLPSFLAISASGAPSLASSSASSASSAGAEPSALATSGMPFSSAAPASGSFSASTSSSSSNSASSSFSPHSTPTAQHPSRTPRTALPPAQDSISLSIPPFSPSKQQSITRHSSSRSPLDSRTHSALTTPPLSRSHSSTHSRSQRQSEGQSPPLYPLHSQERLDASVLASDPGTPNSRRLLAATAPHSFSHNNECNEFSTQQNSTASLVQQQQVMDNFLDATQRMSISLYMSPPAIVKDISSIKPIPSLLNASNGASIAHRRAFSSPSANNSAASAAVVGTEGVPYSSFSLTMPSNQAVIPTPLLSRTQGSVTSPSNMLRSPPSELFSSFSPMHFLAKYSLIKAEGEEDKEKKLDRESWKGEESNDKLRFLGSKGMPSTFDSSAVQSELSEKPGLTSNFATANSTFSSFASRSLSSDLNPQPLTLPFYLRALLSHTITHNAREDAVKHQLLLTLSQMQTLHEKESEALKQQLETAYKEKSSHQQQSYEELKQQREKEAEQMRANQRLREELHERETALSQLKKQHRQLQEDHLALTSDRKMTENETAAAKIAMKRAAEELTVQKKALESAKEKIGELEKKCEEYERNVDELKRALEKETKENKVLRDAKGELVMQLNGEKAENSLLKSRGEQMEEQNSLERRRAAKAEQQLSEIMQVVQRLRKEKEQMSEKELKALSDVKNASAKTSGLATSLEITQRELSEARAKLSEMERKLLQTTHDLDVSQCRVDSLTKRIAEREQRLQRTEKEKEEASGEVVEERKRVAQLINDLTVLQKENKRAMEEKEDLVQEKLVVEKEVERVREEAKRMKEAKNDVETQLAMIRVELETLQNVHRNCHAQATETLRQKIQKMEVKENEEKNKSDSANDEKENNSVRDEGKEKSRNGYQYISGEGEAESEGLWLQTRRRNTERPRRRRKRGGWARNASQNRVDEGGNEETNEDEEGRNRMPSEQTAGLSDNSDETERRRRRRQRHLRRRKRRQEEEEEKVKENEIEKEENESSKQESENSSSSEDDSKEYGSNDDYYDEYEGSNDYLFVSRQLTLTQKELENTQKQRKELAEACLLLMKAMELLRDAVNGTIVLKSKANGEDATIATRQGIQSTKSYSSAGAQIGLSNTFNSSLPPSIQQVAITQVSQGQLRNEDSKSAEEKEEEEQEALESLQTVISILMNEGFDDSNQDDSGSPLQQLSLMQSFIATYQSPIFSSSPALFPNMLMNSDVSASSSSSSNFSAAPMQSYSSQLMSFISTALHLCSPLQVASVLSTLSSQNLKLRSALREQRDTDQRLQKLNEEFASLSKYVALLQSRIHALENDRKATDEKNSDVKKESKDEKPLWNMEEENNKEKESGKEMQKECKKANPSNSKHNSFSELFNSDSFQIITNNGNRNGNENGEINNKNQKSGLENERKKNEDGQISQNEEAKDTLVANEGANSERTTPEHLQSAAQADMSPLLLPLGTFAGTSSNLRSSATLHAIRANPPFPSLSLHSPSDSSPSPAIASSSSTSITSSSLLQSNSPISLTSSLPAGSFNSMEAGTSKLAPKPPLSRTLLGLTTPSSSPFSSLGSFDPSNTSSSSSSPSVSASRLAANLPLQSPVSSSSSSSMFSSFRSQQIIPLLSPQSVTANDTTPNEPLDTTPLASDSASPSAAATRSTSLLLPSVSSPTSFTSASSVTNSGPGAGSAFSYHPSSFSLANSNHINEEAPSEANFVSSEFDIPAFNSFLTASGTTAQLRPTSVEENASVSPSPAESPEDYSFPANPGSSSHLRPMPSSFASLGSRPLPSLQNSFMPSEHRGSSYAGSFSQASENPQMNSLINDSQKQNKE
eukprot:MONOS_486.1-p1 / transcript=MONOS_486.1 / gene=MONOS_486 / organism=Monocercomonoides_exilis_PA203 / gene_product=unspecified product / transcript_product=unspecified product / location=Mono_scaffold00007:279201-285281(-) / protein_length=2027 / sequence_SO=supercontig / SO=protein_coding / is_pseudo=false